MKKYAFVCCLLLACQAMAQAPLLVSGPMLGYAEHREAAIWLEVSPQVREVAVQYCRIDTLTNMPATTFRYAGRLGQLYNPISLVLPNLAMGATYEYTLLLDGKPQVLPYPLQFSTKKLWEWRTAAPDFSLMIGSCAYLNDPPYDRPGRPYGQSTDIFASMTQQKTDLMLWLGDNIYLREADFSSASGIYYRHQQVRRQAVLQALWASRRHLAIWDDHDFGTNDSNQSFDLADTSLHIFTQYWANKTYGQAQNKGIYSKYTWSDCDIWLLDNRYHRSPETLPSTDANQQYLGNEQLQWLKQSLLSSRATFKFVASGSQVLNPLNTFECFRNYSREWNELMDFIVANRISGVVFLSGDRHFSEIISYQPAGGYTLYDITCSPLTSAAYAKVADSAEGNNPNRMEGSLIAEQNYMVLSVKGIKNDRQLSIDAYDATGKLLYTKMLAAKDLQVK